MYAIIKSGGKQLRVTVGDIVDVELLGADEGADVEFKEVLFPGGGKSLFPKVALQVAMVDAALLLLFKPIRKFSLWKNIAIEK